MATVHDARLIPVQDPDGSLLIGDVDLSNGWAWQALSIADVWLQAVRGSNLLVPGNAGVLIGPRRPTVTEMVFPLVVVGSFDESGVENEDAVVGLMENRDQLRERLQLPPALPDVTRTAVWTRRDGSTWTTEVTTVDVAVSAVQPGNLVDWIITVESSHAWEPAGGS